MKLRSYTSEGIILKRRNFDEADRMLWVYSKDYGKVVLIAKGVRLPKSRKRGHIEIFAKVNFQAVKTRNLDLIVEVNTVDFYNEIRNNLKKISLAYYFCEVVEKITNEQEPNNELYNLFLEKLEILKSAKKLKDLRFDFIRSVLVLTGFWPKDKILIDPELKLKEVIEKQIFSQRVGKRMIQ